MPAKLIWTPAARAGAKKIYVDIAREQPQAAERYFQRFRIKATSLIEQPRLGQRHPEIHPAARMLVEAPYVILYQTHPNTDDGPIEIVEIVHVVDGRRDLAALY
ncbi:type II toxin-antitoxin system RelE/ParE family toxin [Rhizobium leguminosarum bv. viciae]|uniref:Type II toxin-antitoxin system RelE/ParE family toxin n=2 Tax=Rhizobium TaxID=379 RepID=A0A8I2KET8_RHILV|nr:MULTISPECIES: type II toxin-antitoxin system RelE/ParE family toxin [Rhizobium]MBA1348326.1 type II toxin-antitoxin system RelE/ParE family toxin [Rhizobium sp. WYCCWR 11146]MBY5772748.1 type II toxin-antitoxin system RelE/ParE family toxin [Rhizobium leguminosarum]MBY5783137.1 type II toxin-antitoxin system RelE/ParE family toxin [Rhizobium leguminosarum]NKM45358.1 type II toxin-antitoxin system RelE/ParE family toxin [Rhizobium leguminosarum bv. viciae]NNU66110.1 type II toxin-antitoxin s